MEATNRIRDRTKPLQSIQTSAPTYFSINTYQMLITNSCANTFFSRLFNSITETVMLTPQHLNKE